jgi:hypothetical protein
LIANTINPKLMMLNTAVPKDVMPTSKVRTATAMLIAAVLLPCTGLAAKFMAILLAIQYIMAAITPAIAEPLRQRMGLGKVLSGVSEVMRWGGKVFAILDRCGCHVAKSSVVIDNARGVY